jgi:hypothetical protein
MTGVKPRISFIAPKKHPLADVARERGMTIVELLLEAFGLEEWYRRETEDGVVVTTRKQGDLF